MTRQKEESRLQQTGAFMDDVYREMFHLEAKRPGAEMGLALALLRAWVAAGMPAEKNKDWGWLKTLCPICLRMIEESLDRGSTVATVMAKPYDPNPMA